MCINLLTSTVTPSVHCPFSNFVHELCTMWTLLSFGKINIEYPVIQVAFKYSHNHFYIKLSTSSWRTLVVTTARIRPLLFNPYWAHHCTNSRTAFVTVHLKSEWIILRILTLVLWKGHQLRLRSDSSERSNMPSVPRPQRGHCERCISFTSNRRLTGCSQQRKYYHTIGLNSGFWQVLLEKDAQEKTAFSTSLGLYEFKVIPFGLVGAPAMFERLMEHVLRGLQWEECLVYMDDIIIPGSSVEQSLERLSYVLAGLCEMQIWNSSHQSVHYSCRVWLSWDSFWNQHRSSENRSCPGLAYTSFSQAS